MIQFSNDDCYELTIFTLYKTVDTMTRDSQLALADVNLNAKCLQFYPKECNDDIATVKVHLYGCPAASLPVRNNEINNKQSPTLIDIVHARSDLIILLSGVLVAGKFSFLFNDANNAFKMYSHRPTDSGDYDVHA